MFHWIELYCIVMQHSLLKGEGHAAGVMDETSLMLRFAFGDFSTASPAQHFGVSCLYHVCQARMFASVCGHAKHCA
jgi:hypothetical protein